MSVWASRRLALSRETGRSPLKEYSQLGRQEPPGQCVPRLEPRNTFDHAFRKSSSMLDSDTQSRVAPVLRRVPSGICILPAGDGRDRQTGLLTSWVQQASFEPPPFVHVRKNGFGY